VDRLLSTVFAGTLPSLVLAVTAVPAGVISTFPVGVGVGVTGVGVGVSGVGVGVTDVGVAVGVDVAVGVAVSVAVAVGVEVAVDVAVGVAVAEERPKTLTSVTLLNVPTVLPCPT
jgi:hypothetical protein